MFTLDGIRYAAVLSGVVLLGGAEAFAAAENVSLGTGIYWALQTMTTVGYGDVPPKTPLGKVIACILMVVGIGFFALITGAVAQRFLSTEIEEVGEEIEASEAEILEQIEVLGRQLQTLEATVRRRGGRVGTIPGDAPTERAGCCDYTVTEPRRRCAKRQLAAWTRRRCSRPLVVGRWAGSGVSSPQSGVCESAGRVTMRVARWLCWLRYRVARRQCAAALLTSLVIAGCGATAPTKTTASATTAHLERTSRSSRPNGDHDPLDFGQDVAGRDDHPRPTVGADWDGVGRARGPAGQGPRAEDRVQPVPVRRRVGERGGV